MINLRDIKKLCKDYTKIENYDKAMADTTQTWHCHHRMEAVYKRDELIKYNLYYDREPHQLIFLTKSEHKALHNKLDIKGSKFSEKHKRHISEALKGRKLEPRSDEYKKKMSESLKGRKLSEEWKAKIADARKGKHWKLVDGKRVWY